MNVQTAEPSMIEQGTLQVSLARTKAAILAGGTGTRLRAVVSDRPKPMALVGGKPFLELQFESLRKSGISRFVFCVGYMYEQIREHFGDGSRWDARIDYAIEQELLGTGGALKNAERHLNDPFLALNGDSYLDTDLNALLAFHLKKKAADPNCMGTIVVTPVKEARQFGSVLLDNEGRVVSFIEKSAAGDGPGEISAGIYIFEPELLGATTAGQNCSLEREIFPALLREGRSLYGFRAEGFFVDIGTPEGYRRLQDHFGAGQP